jgi:hypothetical protein
VIEGGGIRHPAVTGKAVMRAASRLPATDLDVQDHAGLRRIPAGHRLMPELPEVERARAAIERAVMVWVNWA